MRRLLLASTIAAFIPFAAHAELFTIGDSYTFNGLGINGGDFSGPVTLQPGTLALTNTVNLVTSIIPTPNNGEWLVFDMQTNDGQPLSLGGNFFMGQTGLPAAVPVNFDNAFAAVDINGVQQTWFGSVFSNYTPGTDPILGTGLVTPPFTGLFDAGPLPELRAFIDPFSQLGGCCGLDWPNLTSYEEAWHFDSQEVIPPAVPEPSSIALLAVSLLGLGAVAKRKRG